MRITGKRIKRTRLIQTEKYVVAVEVELVIPVDDPSEPCYESETVQLLREIREHAERGDVAVLPEFMAVHRKHNSGLSRLYDTNRRLFDMPSPGLPIPHAQHTAPSLA